MNKNESDLFEQIQSQEEQFNLQIRYAVENLTNHGQEKLRVLTLSGPTCSGKTTTANNLTRRLNDLGYSVIMISLDDFFLDNSHTIGMDGSNLDFDSPSTIDHCLLERVVYGIRKGEKVTLPTFDFKLRKPFMNCVYIPRPNDLIIFEGIQAVYSNVTYILSKYFDNYKSIFIDVDNGVKESDTELTSSDIRLIRRIIRDNRCRGASAEFTLQLWNNVRKNEITNILPNSRNCNIHINSYLDYELAITKSMVSELLNGLHTENSSNLMKKLGNTDIIDGDKLVKLVPKQSVLKEFIGE